MDKLAEVSLDAQSKRKTRSLTRADYSEYNGWWVNGNRCEDFVDQVNSEILTNILCIQYNINSYFRNVVNYPLDLPKIG